MAEDKKSIKVKIEIDVQETNNRQKYKALLDSLAEQKKAAEKNLTEIKLNSKGGFNKSQITDYVNVLKKVEDQYNAIKKIYDAAPKKSGIEKGIDAITNRFPSLQKFGNGTKTAFKAIESGFKGTSSGALKFLNVLKFVGKEETVALVPLGFLLEALAALDAAKDKLVEFGKAAIESFSKFEQFAGSLRGLSASKEDAEALAGSLQQLASETPFDQEQLGEAAQAFADVGVNVKTLGPTLKKLGDVASGTNLPLADISKSFAEAQKKGKLFQSDIDKFEKQGIPIMDAMAEATGKTRGEIEEMGRKGTLSFSDLDAGFNNLTEAGGQFYGAMADSNDTVASANANLGEAVDSVMTKIGSLLAPVQIAYDKVLTTIVQGIDFVLGGIGKIFSLLRGTSDLDKELQQTSDLQAKIISAQTQQDLDDLAIEIELQKQNLKELKDLNDPEEAARIQGHIAQLNTAYTAASKRIKEANTVTIESLEKEISGYNEQLKKASSAEEYKKIAATIFEVENKIRAIKGEARIKTKEEQEEEDRKKKEEEAAAQYMEDWKKETIARNQAAEQADQQILALAYKTQDLKLAAIKDGHEREIQQAKVAAERIRAAQEKEKIKVLYDEKLTDEKKRQYRYALAQQQKQEKEKLNEQLAAIDKKYAQQDAKAKVEELKYKVSLAEAAAKTENGSIEKRQELADAKKQLAIAEVDAQLMAYEKDSIEYKALALKKQEIEKDYQNQLKQLRQQGANEQVQQMITASTQVYNEEIAELGKQLANKEITIEQYYEKLNDIARSKARTNLEVMDEIAMQFAEGTGPLVNATVEEQAKFFDEYAKAQKEAADAAEKTAKLMRDKITDGIKESLGYMKDLLGAINDIYETQSKNKLKRLDKEKKKELDNKNLTEAQKTKIEKKYEKEKEKLEREAFERNKRRRLAEVIINTAIGITGAIAALPLSVGAPQSIAIATLGALQYANIDAEEYRQGGLLHGPSHEQGGIKYNLGGRMVELEGGEFVINRRSTAAYLPTLQAINATKFADGGLVARQIDRSVQQSVSLEPIMEAIQQNLVVSVVDINRAQRRVSDSAARRRL